jgi:hypothetical protein
MSLLETRLGSWKPRRPSARIRRHLFPVPHARPELARALNWLAPATACLLLPVAAFRQESISNNPLHRDPAIAMMLSNQNTAVYLTGDRSQVEHNVLSATFESTNRSGSTFNTGFTPSTKPNQ